MTKNTELLGYTKYTDHLYVSKMKLHEQMKFLAATITREEGYTRVISKSLLGIPSDATVAIWYTAEYSFGYDLQAGEYEITSTAKGSDVRLKKPVLIASPATKLLRHKVLIGGVFIDEKAAVIKLYEGIEQLTVQTGRALASDNAAVALCEKTRRISPRFPCKAARRKASSQYHNYV